MDGARQLLGGHRPVYTFSEYLVMYEDGSFYYEMPLEGLQSFDREKSRREKWSTGAPTHSTALPVMAEGHEPSELELDERRPAGSAAPSPLCAG